MPKDKDFDLEDLAIKQSLWEMEITPVVYGGPPIEDQEPIKEHKEKKLPPGPPPKELLRRLMAKRNLPEEKADAKDATTIVLEDRKHDGVKTEIISGGHEAPPAVNRMRNAPPPKELLRRMMAKRNLSEEKADTKDTVTVVLEDRKHDGVKTEIISGGHEAPPAVNRMRNDPPPKELLRRLMEKRNGKD